MTTSPDVVLALQFAGPIAMYAIEAFQDAVFYDCVKSTTPVLPSNPTPGGLMTWYEEHQKYEGKAKPCLPVDGPYFFLFLFAIAYGPIFYVLLKVLGSTLLAWMLEAIIALLKLLLSLPIAGLIFFGQILLKPFFRGNDEVEQLVAEVKELRQELFEVKQKASALEDEVVSNRIVRVWSSK